MVTGCISELYMTTICHSDLTLYCIFDAHADMTRLANVLVMQGLLKCDGFTKEALGQLSPFDGYYTAQED